MTDQSTDQGNEIDPERITDATTPEGVDGTTEGNPIAGVELDDAEHERAVEPDDRAFEVDGPATGHA